MLPHLLLLLLPLQARSSQVQTRGVSPQLLSLYRPTADKTWKCLNDSTVIPWSAVNDDYCDCPDGSDEPGTGACPDSYFYCANEGHIGAYIPSSRVNDGICEADCCDGSDEAPGVCPNKCKEVGEEYRKKVAAERKLRKTGSKIRGTYIQFAQKEKKRLEESIVTLEKEIATQEKEVARLKDIADHTETISAVALEHKKESPLYQNLITHKNALKSLWKVHQKHLEREKQLGDILEALKGGYNPNYQDMAVLEAVKGWEALSGEQTQEENAQVLSPGEEMEWTEDQLKYQLDPLLQQDYVSLLFAHDEHINKDTTPLLFDLSSYIPESLASQYEAFRDTLVSWLQTLGIIKGSQVSSAVSEKAREAYQNAEKELKANIDKKRDEEEELKELFDPEGFGLEGEWKKLQDLCLSTDAGEYTYEVCLFGAATQKGNAHNNLGHFESWNKDPNVQPGEPAFYTVQHYTRGAKCWNGPERSVTLHLSCGTENKLLTVTEPEKCEYHMTGTTPALCLPLNDASGAKAKQEL